LKWHISRAQELQAIICSLVIALRPDARLSGYESGSRFKQKIGDYHHDCRSYRQLEKF
jgi:hypothetical protein